jgi:hypothetical protein
MSLGYRANAGFHHDTIAPVQGRIAACERDARTPRVPLMRARRPHPQGASYANETPAPPRVPLMRARRPRTQGSSYANETPAPPRVPLMRTRRPHLPGFLLCERDARAPRQCGNALRSRAPGCRGRRDDHNLHPSIQRLTFNHPASDLNMPRARR